MCFTYDESCDIYNEQVVTTRKPHNCESCRRTIAVRSRAVCCSGLFDGAWFRYYVCNRCQRLIYAIAAKELNEGCDWSTAWCAPQDLMEYVLQDYDLVGEDDQRVIRPMAMDTLEDCRRVVVDLHYRITGYARPEETERLAVGDYRLQER